MFSLYELMGVFTNLAAGAGGGGLSSNVHNDRTCMCCIYCFGQSGSHALSGRGRALDSHALRDPGLLQHVA